MNQLGILDTRGAQSSGKTPCFISLKGAPGCTRPMPCSPYLSRLYRAFHSWKWRKAPSWTPNPTPNPDPDPTPNPDQVEAALADDWARDRAGAARLDYSRLFSFYSRRP